MPSSIKHAKENVDPSDEDGECKGAERAFPQSLNEGACKRNQEENKPTGPPTDSRIGEQHPKKNIGNCREDSDRGTHNGLGNPISVISFLCFGTILWIDVNPARINMDAAFAAGDVNTRRIDR